MAAITKSRAFPLFEGLAGTAPSALLRNVPSAGAKFPNYRQLGMLMPMAGGSSPLGGYHVGSDVITRLADGTELNTLWADYINSLRVYNERRDSLVSFLTYSVQNPTEAVAQGGQASFERASEFGVARASRVNITTWQMGFDFQWYDGRVAFTWQFLAENNTPQIDAINNAMIEADNRLIFNNVLHTLFRNTNRSTDIEQRAYTVYSLYNGTDGTTPPAFGSTTFASNHNHYMVSGGHDVGGGVAVVDPSDFVDLVRNVEEHGYSQRYGYQVVVMVNQAELDVIRGWRRGQYYLDGAPVASGTANSVLSTYDWIPSNTQPTLVVPTQEGLLGTQPPNSVNGMPVEGSYGTALVVLEDYIPAKYMVAFATGGPDNLSNPIGIREHANTDMRGLRLIPGDRQAYPLVNSYYSRGFGTGIRHRGAAAVMQIKASGSYAIPAAYATLA